MRREIVVSLLSCVVGCSESVAGSADGGAGAPDTFVPDVSAPADVPVVDVAGDVSGDVSGDAAAATCVSDQACSDGLFCNGVERCDLARGRCLSAEQPACGEEQRCEESTDLCADLPRAFDQVAADNGFVCAVRNARAYCWGNNSHGQLGNGTEVNSSAPTRVSLLDDVASVLGTCVVRMNGTVACWSGGGTSFSTLPVAVPGLANVAELAVGGVGCARLQDRTVVCAGDGRTGALGDGTMDMRATYAAVPGLGDVAQISVGGGHVCALKSSGELLCWGANDNGQLGTGDTMNRSVPTVITAVSNVVEVDASSDYTCVRHANGTLSCWGRNFNGQFGIGTSSGTPQLAPSQVMGINTAVEFVTGGTYSCARLQDRTVQCWGSNSTGQLGDGTLQFHRTPAAVMNLDDATQLSAGAGIVCARRASGALACWGRNQWGELGNGTTEEPSLVPVTVLGGP